MPANSTLTLNVTNDGAMAHDLKVQGTEGTQMLEPGASETITIGPFDASTEAWCTVPGHKEGGMLMAITVEGGGDADVAAAGGAEDEGAAQGGAEIDFDAEHDADWEPFAQELAHAHGGTEHEDTRTAEQRCGKQWVNKCRHH